MSLRSRAQLGLFFFFVVLVFFVPTARASLDEELQGICRSYKSKAHIGLKALVLDEDKTLLETSAQELFHPGSAQKLFVAAAAFNTLGPQFVFRTEVLFDGAIESGVIKGDLVIKGSGDPSFRLEDLENLVLQIKKKNVKEILGNLIIECSEFDEIRMGPGWIWDLQRHGGNIPVEAFVLNQGLVDVWIKPSDISMNAPHVEIDPLVPGICVSNKAIMANIDPYEKSLKVRKKQQRGKDVILVEGALSLKSRPLKFSIPVQYPAHFAATEFSLLLKKHGIKHEGKILFDHNSCCKEVLASHQSAPLFDLVKKMLKFDNDMYANCILKKIGRIKFGKPGTWPNGAQVVREFLLDVAAKEVDEAVIVDGSGESCFNKISPETVALWLKNIHKKFVYAPELMACMPLSGVDGSLKKRFKQKSFFSKLRGISFAFKEDSCLCGYFMTREQKTLVFCLMVQHIKPCQENCAQEIEKKVCEALFKYAKE